MKILFAGGGTAGHINPALAVAGTVRERHPDAQISYVGTAKKLEATLVPERGYDFYTVDVAGFQRKITFQNIGKNIVAARKAVTSSLEAKRILQEIQPDLVVGTGGYVSGPVLRKAVQMGFKTAIHEQ
ncbi:MAG: glycosyltransferase, partial [Clostridia bacterium]|nr:glycosyltransferase [Clostridia bacterium]